MIAEANPDRVREATAEDQGDLLDLCRRSHEETGIGPFSAIKTLAAIDGAIRHGVGVVGVVGMDRVEGSAGLFFEEPWGSETTILISRWLYVLPEYRASTHLRDLAAWAERLSHPHPVGVGVPVLVSEVASRRTEAKQRLYRRHMGEPVAVTWLRETWGD